MVDLRSITDQMDLITLFRNSPHKINRMGVGKMAQWVTCLLCCPEIWVRIPSTYVKIWAWQNALTLALVTGAEMNGSRGSFSLSGGRWFTPGPVRHSHWSLTRNTLTHHFLFSFFLFFFYTQSLTNIEMTTIFKKKLRKTSTLTARRQAYLPLVTMLPLFFLKSVSRI